MFFYTIRKLNLFIITLLILTVVGFNILRLEPDSYWHNVSFWRGWSLYITELSQLNFGVNQAGTAIKDEIRLVFPATLELCFFAFMISLSIGIPLGTLAGMTQGKWTEKIISIVAMFGYSAPVYWVALSMIFLFSHNYEWFPVSGRYDLLYKLEHITGFALIDATLSKNTNRVELFQSVIEHMILPCLVLALAPTTQVIRIMKAAVADIMSQNYIRVARIRGMSQYRIVTEHVLRNAIPSLVSKFGVQLSTMLTFAIITESIFNWPGIGRWLLDALSTRDYISIQAGVIVVAALVLTTNILSDLVGAMINPLVRKAWYANK
jgi:cationic peptide transport system permease protein